MNFFFASCGIRQLSLFIATVNGPKDKMANGQKEKSKSSSKAKAAKSARKDDKTATGSVSGGKDLGNKDVLPDNNNSLSPFCGCR